MTISKLVELLSYQNYEIIKIKDNKVEAHRLAPNGAIWHKIILEVHESGITHLGAYENSDYELIDIKIENEKVEDYIKEDL